MKTICINSDKLHEECGVFGIRVGKNDSLDPTRITHTALYSLQHRGQEACGIAVNDRGVISLEKGLGLVSEVFNEKKLASLSSDSFQGEAAIGHVRYSSYTGNTWANAQPIVISHVKGNMALTYNGRLVNAASLRNELERQGNIFQTTNDSEIIAYLIVRERLRAPSIEEAVKRASAYLEGAFSVILMSPQKMIALRDSHGFRPLCIGKLKNSFIFSSESCVFRAVGAEFLRDVKPGEIAVVRNGELFSLDSGIRTRRTSLCAFEFIYFARPDSVIDGLPVDLARQRMGAHLADEHPANADIVIGVPDSGLSAAIGYSKRSGIPYGIGLVKNRYIARAFIQPTQNEREASVRLKLSVLASEIYGKRVVLVDDAIVRGTTSLHIVSLLREAGALEVHMRVSSPPFIAPCYYGTDIPDKSSLIATDSTVADVARSIGADSLGYLSQGAIDEISKSCSLDLCTSCFGGEYPVLPKH